jgi:hypothetical protein
MIDEKERIHRQRGPWRLLLLGVICGFAVAAFIVWWTAYAPPQFPR